jgi:hypothetical protein
MRAFPSVLLLCSSLFGQLALAGPTETQAKYKAGLQAEADHDYERALATYEEIPAAERTVLVRLHIASMKVRLGRFTEAEELLAALAKDPAASAVRETALGDLADLRARMPRLTVTVASGVGVDLWVTVDDKHVGPPTTLALNPGAHVVIATRAGVEVFRQKVTLLDSQTLEVEIDDRAAPSTAPVGHVSVPSSTPTGATDRLAGGDASRSGLSRAAPFLVGAGVLGLTSGTAFLLARSQSIVVRESCAAQPSYDCDLETAGSGRVRTWQTVGWIGAGAALASAGLGVVLWLTTPESGKSVAVIPTFGRDTASIRIEGRF